MIKVGSNLSVERRRRREHSRPHNLLLPIENARVYQALTSCLMSSIRHNHERERRHHTVVKEKSILCRQHIENVISPSPALPPSAPTSVEISPLSFQLFHVLLYHSLSLSLALLFITMMLHHRAVETRVEWIYSNFSSHKKRSDERERWHCGVEWGRTTAADMRQIWPKKEIPTNSIVPFSLSYNQCRLHIKHTQSSTQSRWHTSVSRQFKSLMINMPKNIDHKTTNFHSSEVRYRLIHGYESCNTNNDRQMLDSSHWKLPENPLHSLSSLSLSCVFSLVLLHSVYISLHISLLDESGWTKLNEGDEWGGWREEKRKCHISGGEREEKLFFA